MSTGRFLRSAPFPATCVVFLCCPPSPSSLSLPLPGLSCQRCPHLVEHSLYPSEVENSWNRGRGRPQRKDAAVGAGLLATPAEICDRGVSRIPVGAERPVLQAKLGHCEGGHHVNREGLGPGPRWRTIADAVVANVLLLPLPLLTRAQLHCASPRISPAHLPGVRILWAGRNGA